MLTRRRLMAMGLLGGGAAVAVYTVACEVTTSAGRVDERTISVQVVQR